MEEGLGANIGVLNSLLGGGLNPCFNGRGFRRLLLSNEDNINLVVLILVLMEEGLGVVFLPILIMLNYMSLNPCFNGRGFRRDLTYTYSFSVR